VKRGLVVLDPAEVPAQEWVDRVAALQRRCAEEGVAVALVYGDVHRSDDIGHLTNLCIYWNEGIVAVPADGEPVFLTKLSPRVHTWMRRTSTLTDLRSGKNFGALVGTLLGDAAPGAVGLVDGALWPRAVVEEITAAAPGREVRPLGGLVREQRVVPSAADLALLRVAAGHLQDALGVATDPGLPDGERIARLEQALRGAGFADVLAGIGHGPDGVSSVEVTGQYRHGWVHAARLLGAGAPGWTAAVAAALRAARGAVAAGVPASVPVEAGRRALTGLPAGATAHVTCVNRADLSTHGDYAAPDAELPLGAAAVVGVEVLFDGGGRVAVADTVLVGAAGAEPLTAATEVLA
jgi:hypothetical protein